MCDARRPCLAGGSVALPPSGGVVSRSSMRLPFCPEEPIALGRESDRGSHAGDAEDDEDGKALDGASACLELAVGER